MLRALPFVLIATGGCLLKPDPPGVQHCAGGSFGGASLFADPDPNTVDYDSTMPSDGLELWFVNPVQSDARMFSVARSSEPGGFGAKMPAPFSATAGSDHEDSITGDGLDMIFLSTRDVGVNQAWEITRPDRIVSFGNTPTLIVGLETVDMRSLDVTLDGKRLYFNSPGGAMSVVARDASGKFGVPTLLIDRGVAFLSISPDELEVFYQPIVGGTEERRVVRSVRPSVDEKFGPAEDILPNAEDPEISSDNRTLYYTFNDQIWSVTRDCP